ncbi:hypothetical protein BU26DRAFT_547790 [Trematosphaeria pertusa]|uniref:Uncharacterized protein n=1 Tax=Trematosphaeria pertusa TaxID=390896 RepID=A0A6A6IRZ3_9PLEO|nr:uncharacterized protein BU26DRAFT_547790 [Trematosphaeria pertusa]KAF2253261.1 hypothetical protein BU26DRAFT_547790 [Trematosphaeria pertusa]
MDAEYTIDECVQLLASYLTNPWQRQRAPKGFDEALTTARSESTSTARVFLDAGFHAWLAYFLATEHEGRHHKGQSAKRKAITALQQFPIERQNQVAMALANVDAHPTVQSAIEDLRHPKRRRLTDATMSVTSTTLTQTASPPMADIHEPATPTITEPTVYNPEHRYTPIGMWKALSSASIEASNQEQTLTGAKINGLVSVFPQWIVRAIRKGHGVGVTMVFPANLPTGRVQCLMSLAISPDKVQRLASVLFDIHLEIEDGFRFVVHNNTVRISPRPEIYLQGAAEKAIIECLGRILSNYLILETKEEKLREPL